MYDRMFERINKTSALVYTVGPVRNERQRKLNNPICQDVEPLPIEKRRGFVFAGRLERMKNVDRLIRIYAKLSKEIRDENPFYIAGYGTQEQSLRDEVNELSKTEKLNVIFLGKVDNTMMLRTDANKRITIMASSTEGMPTAIAEAFSVGVPVVTTAVGDIPSVVKDRENGRLLPLDFKDEEYVAAIEDVLKHYEEYSKAAYEASKPFNRETITRMVINDIKQLINGGTC
jgi:glycosyltransferase involved in cell wall biosynthesis